MLGRNAEDTENTGAEVHDQIDAVIEEAGDPGPGDSPGTDQAVEPVMPAVPFPTFSSRPTLPHQVPGVGFESGRDSRAR